MCPTLSPRPICLPDVQHHFSHPAADEVAGVYSRSSQPSAREAVTVPVPVPHGPRPCPRPLEQPRGDAAGLGCGAGAMASTGHSEPARLLL